MIYKEVLARRREYSKSIVDDLRGRLVGLLPEGLAVVVTGSFARREASEQSDVDYFLLGDEAQLGTGAEAILKEALATVAKAVASAGLKPPSADGAFGKDVETISYMVKNVGGNDDPNIKLTHRLLLLLEGDWLFGEQVFLEARRQLLEDVYVRAEISDHQIVRFLLNDLVRYWRTIGVDFEFKTAEVGKGWGIRNIKLVYSRKLMYFSGVLMVAETAQSTRDAKVRKLQQLVAQTPIERIEGIFGADCSKMLTLYANFLEQIADHSVRKDFESVTLDRATQNERFKALKNAGHHFSLQLEQLLRAAYPPSHPIHHAMLF